MNKEENTEYMGLWGPLRDMQCKTVQETQRRKCIVSQSSYRQEKKDGIAYCNEGIAMHWSSVGLRMDMHCT
jgi:hypothetical protein